MQKRKQERNAVRSRATLSHKLTSRARGTGRKPKPSTLVNHQQASLPLSFVTDKEKLEKNPQTRMIGMADNTTHTRTRKREQDSEDWTNELVPLLYRFRYRCRSSSRALAV